MSESMKRTLLDVGLLFLGTLIGAFGMYFWNGNTKTDQITIKEKMPIVIGGEIFQNQSNGFQYVPKEMDPVTGEREKTDAEYRIEAPEITVKVNGETIAFQPLQEEKRKFDEGKLLFEQSSRLNFELTVPTIDRTKKRAIFYGVRSDGRETIKYSQNVKPRWGWYLEADGDFLQSQFKGDSMKMEHVGGGVRINF